jgi:hypothetical protein
MSTETAAVNHGAFDRAKQKNDLKNIVKGEISGNGFIGVKEEGEKQSHPPTYGLQHGGGSVYQPYGERAFTRMGIAKAIVSANERPLVGPGSWVSRAGEYPLFDGGDVDIPQFWAFLDLDFKISEMDSMLFVEEGRTHVGLIFATGIMRAVTVLGGKMEGGFGMLFESCLACISHTRVRLIDGKHKVGIHVVMKGLFVEQATMLCIVEEMNKRGTVTSIFLEENGFSKDVVDCQPYSNPVTLRLPGVWKSAKCSQCKGGKTWKTCNDPACCIGTTTLTQQSAYMHAGFWVIGESIGDIRTDLVDQDGWQCVDDTILRDLQEGSVGWWCRVLELHDISFVTTTEIDQDGKTLSLPGSNVGLDSDVPTITELFGKIKIAMCKRFLVEKKRKLPTHQKLQDLIDPVTQDFIKRGVVVKTAQDSGIEDRDALTKAVTEFSRNQWGHMFQIQPGDHVTSTKQFIFYFELFKLTPHSDENELVVREKCSLGVLTERSHFSTVMWSTPRKGVVTVMRHDLDKLPKGSIIERVFDGAEFTVIGTHKSGSDVIIETTKKGKTFTEHDFIKDAFRIKKIETGAPPLQHLMFAVQDHSVKNTGLIVRHTNGQDNISVDPSKKFCVIDLSKNYNNVKTNAVEWAQNVREIIENSAAGLKKQNISLALTVESLFFLNNETRSTSSSGVVSAIFSQNVCLNFKLGKTPKRHNSSKFQVIIMPHGVKPMCTCKKDEEKGRKHGGCKSFNHGGNFRSEGAHFAAMDNFSTHKGEDVKRLKMSDANENKSWKTIKKLLFSRVAKATNLSGEVVGDLTMNPQQLMSMFDDENLKPPKSTSPTAVDKVFGGMDPGAPNAIYMGFMSCGGFKEENRKKVLHQTAERIKTIENHYEILQRKDSMWTYVEDILRSECLNE